jgi:hypothetical protein
MSFTHYTQDLGAFKSILQNGLLINPCERELMHLFSQDAKVIATDPQKFGMTCLRNEGLIASRKHCAEYGRYGLVFKKEWVFANDFLPGTYVGKSSNKTKELGAIFNMGFKEFKSQFPSGSVEEFLVINKPMAEMYGFDNYARFLSEYEYLECEMNSWEKEWRRVAPLPDYSIAGTQERIAAIQSRDNWGQYLWRLEFSSSDLEGIVAPYFKKKEVENILKELNIRLRVFSKMKF